MKRAESRHTCFYCQWRGLVLLLLLVVPVSVFSQRVVVNSTSTLYQLSNGSACASNYQFSYCNPYAQNNFLLSTAIYKDTLVIVSPAGKLFRMRLGDTGGCVEFITFPSNGFASAQINSLVSSKDGMVYAADAQSRDLYTYSPYTNVLTRLGLLNVAPSGDLIFYKDKLIMAAQDGNLYEVNQTDPANSSIYIAATPGRVYHGLITIPFDCFTNKYYAFERVPASNVTHVYELDMVNRTVVGAVCDLPFLVYDGASNTDDGTTLGITVDSILVYPPCGRNATGTVQVRASTASTGLEYTLNNTTTNSTGLFTNLTPGTYSLHIKNSRGCTKDTTFKVEYGISPDWTIEKWRATNCNTADGRIIIHATSHYLPLSFSHNNGPWITDSNFAALSGGANYIRIKDANGCMVDSNYVIGYSSLPSYLSAIETSPSFCTRRNGVIQLVPAPGNNLSNFTATLNNGPLLSGAQFGNLDAGTYLLHINNLQNCSIDTIVTVLHDSNPAPAINFQVISQHCSGNNGSVGISIIGGFSPYQTNIDAGNFSSAIQYSNLPPGSHSIQIKDVDGCVKDSFVAVLPYVQETVAKTIASVNPSCTAPASGSITVNVTGSRAPYRLSMRNRTYSANTSITGLEEGSYTVYIYNADDCLIDSLVNIELTMTVTPDCEVLQIPSGFTPNGDGLNDIFKPLAGAWLNIYRLSIFNRNGERVFYTTDRTAGWDGRVNSIKQSTGVFAWTLEYNTFGNPQVIIKKGVLVLIR